MKTNITKTTRLAEQANKLMLIAGSLAWVLAGSASASPTGGVIAQGSGSITPGANTVVEQTSPRLVVNWQSFNVDANESVHFDQQSASDAVLNRIDGASGVSQVFGDITAQGQVFLVNPSGIVFGRTASINVGSLIATTMDISDSDFMSGNYDLDALTSANGNIVNQGDITAVSGGIYLIAGGINNRGMLRASQMVADNGVIRLAAGAGDVVARGELVTQDLAVSAVNDVDLSRAQIDATGDLDIEFGQNGSGGTLEVPVLAANVGGTAVARGGDGDDTIVGDRSYTVTGLDEGSSGLFDSWTGVENLEGSRSADTLVIAAGGTLTGILRGGGQNDNFIIAGNANQLEGNAGDDTFTIQGAGQANIIDGDGSAVLGFTDTVVNVTDINATGPGSGSSAEVGEWRNIEAVVPAPEPPPVTPTPPSDDDVARQLADPGVEPVLADVSNASLGLYSAATPAIRLPCDQNPDEEVTDAYDCSCEGDACN